MKSLHILDYNHLSSVSKKIRVLLLALILFPQLGQAVIHDFETTRLKSTAGAGAGSLLVEEATVLNPASMSFFGLTSIYLQKAGVDKSFSGPGEDRTTDNDQLAVIISDSAPGRVSGSLSYVNQTEGYDKRKRFSFSMANSLGESTSMGLAYRLTQDELSSNGVDYSHSKYNQLVAGLTHVINESVSFGLVVIDPLRKIKQDTKAILGMQYTYQSFISLILDGGADYNRNLSDTALYKAALQFRILQDFFLRLGTYNDKGLSEKGNGIGVGWVQPKLSIEVALKNTKVDKNEELQQDSSKIKETSFSLSYRF